jgi:hypothetical protein
MSTVTVYEIATGGVRALYDNIANSIVLFILAMMLVVIVLLSIDKV